MAPNWVMSRRADGESRIGVKVLGSNRAEGRGAGRHGSSGATGAR